ncbi:MAG: hypothetical protein AAF664_15230, partial [Planctomycetota bacterium]
HASVPQLGREQRHLLKYLDGNHDHAQLAEILNHFRNDSDVPNGGSTATEPSGSESVSKMLERFAGLLLLTA